MVGVKTIILTLDGKTEEALKDLINRFDKIEIFTPKHPAIQKYLPYSELNSNQVLIRAYKTYKHPKGGNRNAQQ